VGGGTHPWLGLAQHTFRQTSPILKLRINNALIIVFNSKLQKSNSNWDIDIFQFSELKFSGAHVWSGEGPKIFKSFSDFLAKSGNSKHLRLCQRPRAAHALRSDQRLIFDISRGGVV
jgi:hypothetical protein